MGCLSVGYNFPFFKFGLHSLLTKRILVFEYFSAGGLSQQTLPESLLKEGLLMLQTLLGELDKISDVELNVVLDYRCTSLPLKESSVVNWIGSNQNFFDELPELVKPVDYVWPIAPETDRILERLSLLVENSGKRLLNSSSSVIALYANKLLTFQALKSIEVATIQTQRLDQFEYDFPLPWVVKPIDGAGCENTFFVLDDQSLTQLKTGLENYGNYLIQPYIEGDALSLCCLFRANQGWLLTVNRQRVTIENKQFVLKRCEVNLSEESHSLFQSMIRELANISDGLWGFVGIDLIVPKDKTPIVVEINPRLTSSYVGVGRATGINVAQTILDMVDCVPMIQLLNDQQIQISLHE